MVRVFCTIKFLAVIPLGAFWPLTLSLVVGHGAWAPVGVAETLWRCGVWSVVCVVVSWYRTDQCAVSAQWTVETGMSRMICALTSVSCSVSLYES